MFTSAAEEPFQIWRSSHIQDTETVSWLLFYPRLLALVQRDQPPWLSVSWMNSFMASILSSDLSPVFCFLASSSGSTPDAHLGDLQSVWHGDQHVQGGGGRVQFPGARSWPLAGSGSGGRCWGEGGVGEMTDHWTLLAGHVGVLPMLDVGEDGGARVGHHHRHRVGLKHIQLIKVSLNLC